MAINKRYEFLFILYLFYILSFKERNKSQLISFFIFPLTIKSEKHEMMLTFWGTSFHSNIPMPVRIANVNLCICERICLNLTIKYFELLLYQTCSIYSHNLKKKWKLHKFLFMIPYTCTRHLVISFLCRRLTHLCRISIQYSIIFWSFNLIHERGFLWHFCHF